MKVQDSYFCVTHRAVMMYNKQYIYNKAIIVESEDLLWGK